MSTCLNNNNNDDDNNNEKKKEKKRKKKKEKRKEKKKKKKKRKQTNTRSHRSPRNIEPLTFLRYIRLPQETPTSFHAPLISWLFFLRAAFFEENRNADDYDDEDVTPRGKSLMIPNVRILMIEKGRKFV
ncbi:hypothetical protein V1477_020111 [Vespula maculifrons]|uniref:Uncharacterized protein n=1 Tax=Vespula maculifrons TaxID=7453 RepID=A0ABD2AL08_VESMC